jgi:superfamily II DNA or RNA helicase
MIRLFHPSSITSEYTSPKLVEGGVNQSEFFDGVLTECSRRMSYILSLPTGSGKTYLAALLIAKVLQQGGKVLFLATTNILVKQQHGVISRLLNARCRHYTADQSRIGDQFSTDDVVFTTGHLFAMRYSLLKTINRFDLVIFDEIHNISELSPYFVLLTEYRGDILGLSASVGSSLELIRGVLDRPIHIVHRSALHQNKKYYRIYCSRSPLRLENTSILDQGISRDLRVHTPLLKLFKGNRLSINCILELTDFRLKMRLIPKYTLWKYCITQPSEVFNAALDRNLSLMVKLGLKRVSDSDPKTQAIIRILQNRGDKKCIIFAEYVEAVKSIGLQLIRSGHSVSLLLGKSNKINQSQALQSFRSGGTNILVCSRIGDEGLDIESADCGIFYDPTISLRKFIQRSGRIARGGHSQGSIFICAVEDSVESVKLDVMPALLGMSWSEFSGW